jgi:hypothetical protein
VNGGADGGHDAIPGGHVTSPRKLLLDNSASMSDFGPHPVLVALDATKIDYAMVANPATDLRFELATAGTTTPVGANVPFEIEKWDPKGESIVWIRVPEILHGPGTAVLMYFGPDAHGAASAAATWENWDLVNHMVPGVANSIGAFTPSGINVQFMPGQFGDAAAFVGGGDQRVTFANSGALFDGWNAFYLSFWIYADYNSGAELGTDRIVIDKGGPITLGRLRASGNDIVFQLDEHFTGTGNDVFLSTTVPPKTWTYLAFQFDGLITWIAKNGIMGSTVDLNGDAQALIAGALPIRLGDTSTVFRGRIDELRVEHRSRRIDYARAQYLIGTRQFVTFTDP